MIAADGQGIWYQDYGVPLDSPTHVFRVSRWGIAVGYTYAHEQFQGAELEERAFFEYGHENIVIRDNEVADTRLNQDGMAYDADSGDGTVYEYNDSRQNEGVPFIRQNMDGGNFAQSNDQIIELDQI